MKKYLIPLMSIILSNVYIYANPQSIQDQIKKLEKDKAVFDKNLADKEQAYENAKKSLENQKEQNKNNPEKLKEIEKGLENLEIAYNGEGGLKGDVVKKIEEIKAQINTLKDQLPPSQTPGTGNTNNIINSNANQNASISAMGSNYQLFLANLNSLNKRMGELRDNPKDQGVWARIFTGLQTSKFAPQTNSFYTTIQGGYDHAFGFNGANNYTGFAISYINSSAKNLDTSYKGITNGIELAIYNAYVQDGASSATGWKNGLYTDSIIKFSLMYNSLTLLNQNDEYSIDNFAFTLSQEVGYRFILGQSNEWYIDPQAELTFGYFDQSNFKQIISNTNTINALQDSIITLRSRIGSSFGYKFDRFTENFKAQAYLGTYFVGDYIAGGDISLTSNLNKTISLTPLNSTARFTMNLGTNIAIKDDHRIYFDFERSFGGSIITQYQFNLGYRYSFGESKYTPYSGVSTVGSDAKVLKK